MPKVQHNVYKYLRGEGYHPDAIGIVDNCLLNVPARRLICALYDEVGQGFCLTAEEKLNPPHRGHWFVKPENAGQAGAWDVIIPVRFRGYDFEVRLRSAHPQSKRSEIRGGPGVTAQMRNTFAWAWTTAFCAGYWRLFSNALLVPSKR